MSREGAYIVFCMERYRHAKNMTGAAVANLFSRYGVFAHPIWRVCAFEEVFRCASHDGGGVGVRRY